MLTIEGMREALLRHVRVEFENMQRKQQEYFFAAAELEQGMREIEMLEPTENLRTDAYFVGLPWKEFKRRIENRRTPDKMDQRLTNMRSE